VWAIDREGSSAYFCLLLIDDFGEFLFHFECGSLLFDEVEFLEIK